GWAAALRGVRVERLLPLFAGQAKAAESSSLRAAGEVGGGPGTPCSVSERMFYNCWVAEAAFDPRRIEVEYLEQPCKTALNRVKGMPFNWSLNPYTGCEHRCAFCYVRAFELRADRPSDDRYGRAVRVKVNVAGVLRGELSRKSWRKDTVVIGAATDPYQPAEGRYKLTRQCLQALRDLANPAALNPRGPMV